MANYRLGHKKLKHGILNIYIIHISAYTLPFGPVTKILVCVSKSFIISLTCEINCIPWGL